MVEYIHTSARQGIIPGRSGYTPVAWTAGFPPNLSSPLENLCGYKPIFTGADAGRNPENFTYFKFDYGSSVNRIISRIGYTGLDHTGRFNKIAHHLILTPGEEREKCLRTFTRSPNF